MTGSRIPKRSVLTALVGAVAMLMSACGTHPGSAAVVGSERISDERVDDVASALCAAQAGGAQSGQPSQPLASRAARQGALDVLLNSTLSRQFGESEGVQPDQKQVSAALAANAQSISDLPRDHQEIFRQTLREFAEGQLMLVEVGRQELAKGGSGNVADEQAISEGTRLRNAWAAKNAEVSVDPRYGTYSKNALVASSGSLSVASSSRATDGDSPDPSAGWVSSLPASQKCS